MTSALNVGIISDLDDQRASQLMTDAALMHVSEHLSIDFQHTWMTTSALGNQDYGNDAMKDLDAVWAGPGDYEHPDAAIGAIQYCREHYKPFFGT